MAPTRTIAGLSGPPIAIVGASMLVRPTAFAGMSASLESSVAVVYLVGVLVLIAGCAIVRVHNVWTLRPPVIVTIVGWLAIVGGLARLLLPQTMALRTIAFAQEPLSVMIVGAAAIVLGGYLTLLSHQKPDA